MNLSDNLKGKEFEALVLFRAQKLEEAGVMTMGRYGVQAIMMKSLTTGKPEWQVIPSLPDFDGCLNGGRQIIIEAKVCSQASYPIYHTNKKRPKQIDHMLLRSRFGALCFLLIHFNARHLMRSSQEAQTYAIPVNGDSHFWRMYQATELKSIDRNDAENYGIKVPWNLYSQRASKLTPDLTVLIPEKEFALTT